jgi:hypothetical protein
LTLGRANPDLILKAFHVYTEHEGLEIRRSDFRLNLIEKMGRRDFLGDIIPLLGRAVTYDPHEAQALVDRELIGRV